MNFRMLLGWYIKPVKTVIQLMVISYVTGSKLMNSKH